MEYEELYLFETGQPITVNNDRLSNSNIIKNISFDQTEILHIRWNTPQHRGVQLYGGTEIGIQNGGQVHAPVKQPHNIGQ